MSLHHGFTSGFTITPHDSTNFTRPCEAIYVGGSAAGDIVVVMASGDVVTFPDVPIGSVLPVKAKRVNSTGTAATVDLVALWGA